jgi:hypothetical protein
MLKLTYLMPVPVSDEGPLAATAHIDGPYGMLAQAEYAARIWRRLNCAAEIVVDGPRGSWCVHVAGAAL